MTIQRQVVGIFVDPQPGQAMLASLAGLRVNKPGPGSHYRAVVRHWSGERRIVRHGFKNNGARRGAGDIFQFFGHSPAQPAQFTAASGAFGTAMDQIGLYTNGPVI